MKNLIKDKIYEIRGKQVMLDSELASLYGCKNGSKSINLAVKRNLERFPDNFRFQLTEEEYSKLRFQIETLNIDFEENKRLMRLQTETLNEKETSRGNNLKYLPYVFTEQGVAMLSAVLRTPRAVEVSVDIMNAFVEMRKFIENNYELFNTLGKHETKFLEYDKKFSEIFKKIKKYEIGKEQIFFKGQVYDAHTFLIKIFSKAKKNILIIDNYIDLSLIDMFKDKLDNVQIKIITSTFYKNQISKRDISKYNKQYGNLNIVESKDYHDRFIMIDFKTLYHCGTSLKDLGNKCFSINIIEDKGYKKRILENVHGEFKDN